MNKNPRPPNLNTRDCLARGERDGKSTYRATFPGTPFDLLVISVLRDVTYTTLDACASWCEDETLDHTLR